MELEKREADFNMFDWWKKVLIENYANFNGRARRSEYWYFVLVNVLMTIALGICMMITANNFGEESLIFIFAALFLGIFSLGMIIPSIAVSVRRLHDIGKSGWWYVLGVIPIVSLVGGIILLVFYCTNGDQGPNDYGPDPKADVF